MRPNSKIIATVLVSVLMAVAMPPSLNAQEKRIVRIEIVDRTARGTQVEESGGIGVVRVTQGDQVELHWTSNEATELHLHGYNVRTPVEEERGAIMRVDARAAGRFAIESHGFGADDHAEKTLIYLEVLPR